MANIYLKTLIIGAVVVATQALLGNIINGLMPSITGFSVGGFFSVGGALTAAAGVFIGELIVKKMN